MFRNSNSLPPKIEHWLVERKLKIEVGLTLLTLVGLLLHAAKINGGAEVIVISMSALAGLYFLLSYTKPDMEGWFSMIAFRVISMASAVSVIGLLFAILRFEGADEMMMIGFSAMSGASLILLYYLIKQWNDKLKPLLMRVLILIVITALVRFDVIAF